MGLGVTSPPGDNWCAPSEVAVALSGRCRGPRKGSAPAARHTPRKRAPAMPAFRAADEAFIGVRQGAMNVLLDDDHGHTRLPGVLETIEDQVDHSRSQSEGHLVC